VTNDGTTTPSIPSAPEPGTEQAEGTTTEPTTRVGLRQRVSAAPRWVRWSAAGLLALALVFGIGAGGFALGQESGGHGGEHGRSHGDGDHRSERGDQEESTDSTDEESDDPTDDPDPTVSPSPTTAG
jgi:hypothetical protein